MAPFVPKFLYSLDPYPDIIAGKRGGGYGRLEGGIRSGGEDPSHACITAHKGRGINLIAISPGIF